MYNYSKSITINKVKIIKKREGRRSKYKLASFYNIFQIPECVWKYIKVNCQIFG